MIEDIGIDDNFGELLICPECCRTELEFEITSKESMSSGGCTCGVEPIRFWAERDLRGITKWLDDLKRPLDRKILSELHQRRTSHENVRQEVLFAAGLFYEPAVEAFLQEWNICLGTSDNCSGCYGLVKSEENTLLISGTAEWPRAVTVIHEIAHAVVCQETDAYLVIDGTPAETSHGPTWQSTFLRAALRAREIGDNELADLIEQDVIFQIGRD